MSSHRIDQAFENDDFVAYVVDDAPLVVRSICTLLASQNIKTLEFTSAKDFISNVEVMKRSCVICDYKMPEMDGLQVQEHLIAHGIEIPLIFLSGEANVQMTVQAFKGGAVTVIQKPFETEVFLQEIRQAFHASESNWERRDALDKFEDVTVSELLVLKHLVAGKINKQIARLIGQSERTVERRKYKILEKTRTSSIVEAADTARKAGIDLSLPEV
ncbi:MAG: response regulator [Planctomycetota bacterium]|nr:response regulator [Planctomycetota bacterium]